jgi:hypothetical protein
LLCDRACSESRVASGRCQSGGSTHHTLRDGGVSGWPNIAMSSTIPRVCLSFPVQRRFLSPVRFPRRVPPRKEKSGRCHKLVTIVFKRSSLIMFLEGRFSCQSSQVVNNEISSSRRSIKPCPRCRVSQNCFCAIRWHWFVYIRQCKSFFSLDRLFLFSNP